MDFDTEQADWHIRMRRDYARAGKQPHWRPATSRAERLQAQEITRRVERIAIGYRASSSSSSSVDGGPGRCYECGRKFRYKDQAYLSRQIYTAEGRVDLYKHRGGCPVRKPAQRAKGA